MAAVQSTLFYSHSNLAAINTYSACLHICQHFSIENIPLTSTTWFPVYQFAKSKNICIIVKKHALQHLCLNSRRDKIAITRSWSLCFLSWILLLPSRSCVTLLILKLWDFNGLFIEGSQKTRTMHVFANAAHSSKVRNNVDNTARYCKRWLKNKHKKDSSTVKHLSQKNKIRQNQWRSGIILRWARGELRTGNQS